MFRFLFTAIVGITLIGCGLEQDIYNKKNTVNSLKREIESLVEVATPQGDAQYCENDISQLVSSLSFKCSNLRMELAPEECVSGLNQILQTYPNLNCIIKGDNPGFSKDTLINNSVFNKSLRLINGVCSQEIINEVMDTISFCSSSLSQADYEYCKYTILKINTRYGDYSCSGQESYIKNSISKIIDSLQNYEDSSL